MFGIHGIPAHGIRRGVTVAGIIRGTIHGIQAGIRLGTMAAIMVDITVATMVVGMAVDITITIRVIIMAADTTIGMETITMQDIIKTDAEATSTVRAVPLHHTTEEDRLQREVLRWEEAARMPT